MDTATTVHFYDYIIALVVLMVVGAIIAMAVLQREVPQYLVDAFAACMGWLLRGGAQVANELYHAGKDGNNAGPNASGGSGSGGAGVSASGGAGDGSTTPAG